MGTIIQLAPLAAIFVYYSAPSEIEDGKVLCFKTVRTYNEQVYEGSSYAQNVKNEYYIYLIDYEKGEITELAKILDDKFYDLDDGMIYYKEDEDKITFALNEPQGTWQLNMDGTSLKKISAKNSMLAKASNSKNYYAYLPCPKIKDISYY